MSRGLRLAPTLLSLAVLAASLVASDAAAKPAKRRVKKPRVAEQADWASAPSARYGAMTQAACLSELRRRKIAFSEVESARGVLAPVRLKGELGGVVYRTELAASERPTSPHEVFDCRLVLGLHDLSAILVKYDVAEVHMFSAWRPPPKSWPADKQAIRHPGGLAIDIRRFVKKAVGTSKPKDLVVDRDWTAARNVPPCTASARASGNADQQQLRAIFCEADQDRLFTSMLSPNYDAAHKNHFHLEVRPDVKWRLVL